MRAVATIKNGSMIISPDYPHRTKLNRSKKQLENEKNLSRGKRNGYMSTKTKSKIKNYLDHFLFLERYANSIHSKLCRISFLTLTLPSKQVHDDRFIKKEILKPFMKEIIKKYDIRCYLWVAEAQKNGNIHFHILLDKYIDNRTSVKNAQGQIIKQRSFEDDDYAPLTKMWNLYLAKFDYIKAYQENQLKNGKKPQIMPNSVDIHKIENKNNIKSYLTKYLTKSDKESQKARKIKGLLWSCSSILREQKPYQEVFDEDLANTIESMKAEDPKQVNTVYITDEGQMKEPEFIEKMKESLYLKVFATVIFYPQYKFEKHASQAFKIRFRQFYKSLFEIIYLSPKSSVGILQTAVAVPPTESVEV